MSIYSGSANKEENEQETPEEHKESTSVMKNLEQQYESSRYLTHMARGYGLGYGYSSTSDSTDLNKWINYSIFLNTLTFLC